MNTFCSALPTDLVTHGAFCWWTDTCVAELNLDMQMIEKLNQEFAEEQKQMSDDKIRLKKELDTWVEHDFGESLADEWK